MKTKFLYLLLLCSFTAFSQTKVLSWNLENFGKSKTDQEISFIASTIKDYDIIAILEVVAGNGGAQAVARLADELNRKGTKWDYQISDPTSSITKGTERYAFIWKTSNVKLKGKAWLEQKYQAEIEREPYFATFEIKNKTITIAAFHAVPKSKHPEAEIKYLKLLPQEYPNLNIVFAGDFNCPQSHSVFTPLKKLGFSPILTNQKTSLKTKPKDGNYLASEYDNVFYKTSPINFLKSDVILFYEKFSSLKEARKISDHLPIWFQFSLN